MPESVNDYLYKLEKNCSKLSRIRNTNVIDEAVIMAVVLATRTIDRAVLTRCEREWKRVLSEIMPRSGLKISTLQLRMSVFIRITVSQF